FEQFLLTVPNGLDGSKPTKIISPIDLETATIDVTIYPKESIVITYNWTQKGSLIEAIIQVSSLLLLVLPHYEASLTTSQQLKNSFKEVRWMSANAPIRP